PMDFGSINVGVKTSDVYTEGNISLLLPVWSTFGSDGTLEGSQIFVTPYSSLGEGGELANSLGLGWRHLFSDQSVSALNHTEGVSGFLTEGLYVGANVFLDNLRTQFDNDFWQLGVGAELGTRYLELRGNYYIPLDSSRKLAERTKRTQRFTDTSSRSRLQTSPAYGSLSATENAIEQDVTLTTSLVTTRRTTTTTVRTITSLYEEGMEGWDVEAAVLVPGLDKYLDVTLLAGYYSFDNQPFVPQRGGSGETEGWKFGIEVRPVPAVVLTGTWYEDEGLTGSDWVVGAGLQIPLGKDWKDAFKPRRRHLIERMAEPVARQNAAIKTALSVDVDQQVSRQTNTAVVRRVVKQESHRINIAEDIVFVNNGSATSQGVQEGSASGEGTAESPVDTLQAGANLAVQQNITTGRVWTVYTQGGGPAYAENVDILGSMNLVTSGRLIVSPYSGATFGTGQRPALTGGFQGNAGTFLPNTSTPTFVGISGYDISGGHTSTGNGIALTNVDQLAIVGNNIIGTPGHGIKIDNNKDLTADLRENSVSETSLGAGLYIRLINNADFTGGISYNTLSDNNGYGLHFDASSLNNVSNFNGNIIGNTANNNTAGGASIGSISIDMGGGVFTGDLAYNTTQDNEGYGILLAAWRIVGDIHHNVAERSGNQTGGSSLINPVGMAVSVDSLEGDIYNNTFGSNESEGFYLSADGNVTGSIYGNISKNDNVDDSLYGVGLLVSIQGTFTGDVKNNVVQGSTTRWGFAFYANAFDAQNGKFGFFDNIATGSKFADIVTSVFDILNGPLSSTSNPGAGVIDNNFLAPVATP
ncbi:MAG: inverse autotransporter beta domain-containing protein, partial [Verrucomicrobium sp.]